MARLPSEMYLIQQHDGIVDLFEDFTERLVVRFDPANGGALPAVLMVIRDSELGEEDKSFACFWSGYFHAHANRDPEMARERYVTEADDGTVFVMNGSAIIVSFDPADANAASRAQKNIHDCGLGQIEKDLAHFWSGFFYGQAC